MKANKISLIIAFVLAITLAGASGSNAQIGTIWSLENDCYVFLGSANMDGDPQEELVYHHPYPFNDQRVIIIDGSTASIEWDSGVWYMIFIAGHTATLSDYTKSFGNTPFCDIDNDGVKEIIFSGMESSGDPQRIYVVGYGGSGLAGSGGGEVPGIHILSQNYPNPFNPTTTIQYTVTAPGQVTVKIYNSLGQEINTLVDEYKFAGEYSATWDGKDGTGSIVASGTYFYQMKVGDFVSTKKSIMLK